MEEQGQQVNQNNPNSNEEANVEEGKSFEVVRAEVNELLARYLEENEVPFAWEAKILMDNVAEAIHDQFASNEEDITKLYEEIERLKQQQGRVRGSQ